MSHRKTRLIGSLLAVICLLPLLWMACSNKNPTTPSDTTPTTPTDTTLLKRVRTVSVTPASPSVAVGDSQQFVAVARDSALATLSGVTFAWASSNSATATINASGKAIGVAAGGPVTITATATGTSPAISGATTLTVVTQSTTGSIQVTTTPAGASVYVDSTLRGTSPLIVTLVPEGNHVVTAILAGYKSKSQTVAVTAGNTANVSMTLDAVGRAFNIEIAALPKSIYVQGTGYQPSITTITVTVTDSLGDPTPSKTVTFSQTKYPGTLSAASGVTGSDGKVIVYYTSGTSSGTVEIRAATPEIVTPIILRITVLSGPPHAQHFSIVPNVFNIAGRRTYGLTDVITAFVFDRWGNPVPDNTMLWFWTNRGGITPGQATTTNGQATNTLVSCAPTDTFAYITSETRDSAGGRIYATCKVLFSGWTSVVAVAPNTFNIPNSSAQSFTLTVSDDYGMPLVGGSAVSLSLVGTGKGTIDPASFSIPDALYPGTGTTQFQFSISNTDTTAASAGGASVRVSVTSSNGNVITDAASGTLQ